jgi:cell wall-associated NlpC family hydrolase
MLSTDAPKHVLVVRVAIAQAALDAFVGRPFAWGTSDCAGLASFVMTRAGLKPNLAQFGHYRSDRDALRALRTRKMKTVLDWVDSVKGVRRITPAAALPGDLIAFPGEGGWHGLTVYLGNGRVLGYTEAAADGACSIIAAKMEFAEAAWSVPPWQKS